MLGRNINELLIFMINPILSALVYEMIHFLTSRKEYFKQNSSEREEQLKNLKVPVAFKHYFAEVSAEDFMEDLKIAMGIISGAPLSQFPLKGNGLFQALAEFFNSSFAEKMDELPGNFYLLSYEDRVSKAKEIIESETRISSALREILALNSYQELAGYLQEFNRLVNEVDLVLVQTPRDLDSEFKKEIRKVLLEKFPDTFPVFQVNRGLIGGFRVFVNGTSHDHSWLSRITKITSLKMVS